MGHFSGNASVVPRYFRCSEHVQDTRPQLKGQSRPRPGLPFISQRLPAHEAAGATVGPSAHVTGTRFTDGSPARLTPQNTRVTSTVCSSAPAVPREPCVPLPRGVLGSFPGCSRRAFPHSPHPATRWKGCSSHAGGPEQDSTATARGQGGPHPARSPQPQPRPRPEGPAPPGPAEPPLLPSDAQDIRGGPSL